MRLRLSTGAERAGAPVLRSRILVGHGAFDDLFWVSEVRRMRGQWCGYWGMGIVLSVLGAGPAEAQDSLDDFLNTASVVAPQPGPRKSSDISRVQEQYGDSFRACEAGMRVATREVVMFEVVVDKRGRVSRLRASGTGGLPEEVQDCLDAASRVVQGRVHMPPANHDKELELPLELRGPLWTSSLTLPVTLAPMGEEAEVATALSSGIEVRAEALGQCVAKAVWGDETRGRPAPTYALADLVSDGVIVALSAPEAVITSVAVEAPKGGADEQAVSLFTRLWAGERAAGAASCYAAAFEGLSVPAPGTSRVMAKIDMTAAGDGYGASN
jgi:hypothetical protein